jgi:hypothetical protein
MALYWTMDKLVTCDKMTNWRVMTVPCFRHCSTACHMGLSTIASGLRVQGNLVLSFFFFSRFPHFVCINVLPSCIYVCVPKKQEEFLGSPRLGGIEVYKRWCMCWEPNSGPLPEQQMHFTAEPSLQASLSTVLPTVCHSSFLKVCIYTIYNSMYILHTHV